MTRQHKWIWFCALLAVSLSLFGYGIYLIRSGHLVGVASYDGFVALYMVAPAMGLGVAFYILFFAREKEAFAWFHESRLRITPEMRAAVVVDEPWRDSHSGITFVENLKDSIEAIETDLLRVLSLRQYYQEKKESFDLASDSFTYDPAEAVMVFKNLDEQEAKCRKLLATTKQRIEAVLAGRVQSEITTLNSEIQRLEAERGGLPTGDRRLDSKLVSLRSLVTELVELQPVAEDTRRFEGYKKKRVFDARQEIFEAVFLPATTAMELEKAYEKQKIEINRDSTYTNLQKDRLLAILTEQYEKAMDKIRGRDRSIYED